MHDNVYVLDDVARHGVRLLYAARIDGDLTPGPGGEIAAVGWHPVDALPESATAWAVLGARLATR